MSKNILLLINKDKNIIACKKRAKKLLALNYNQLLSLTECKSLAAKELGFKDWFDLHNKTKHKYILTQEQNKKSAKLLFEELLEEALLNDASDIHIQCNENDTTCSIKLRISGEISDIVNQPSLSYEDSLSILTYLYKTIKLDSIFEQPYQTISCTINSEALDLRIQTIPTTANDFKMIVRLMRSNETQKLTKLSQLGYTDSHIKQLQNLNLQQDSNLIIAGHVGAYKSDILKNLLDTSKNDLNSKKLDNLSFHKEDNIILTENNESYKLDIVDIKKHPSILDLKNQHEDNAHIIFKSKIIRKTIKDN